MRPLERFYAGMIEEGTLSIMAGAYRPSRLCQGVGRDGTGGRSARHAFPVLISRLLREKLGFQGLVISDATPMVGFLLRHEARGRGYRPVSWRAATCFLFNKDLQEDIVYMKRGLERGVLTEARLEEAVIRILGLKAALGLHEKQERHALIPSGEAQRVIGLPGTYAAGSRMRRCIGNAGQGYGQPSSAAPTEVQAPSAGGSRGLSQQRARGKKTATQLLSEQGFHVIPYVREGIAQDGSLMVDTVEQFKAKV